MANRRRLPVLELGGGTRWAAAVARAFSLLLPRLERDDDLFPGLQVFQLHHTVGISGLQDLRGQ